MALIPTTFLRHPDVSTEMLRGVGNAQMGILLNQMSLGGLNCGRRVVEYASGVVITCTVNYRERHLDIVVPENLGGENIHEEYVTGFMCHPGVGHAYDQVQATVEDRKGNRVVLYDAKQDQWHAQDYVVRITTTDLFGNVIKVENTGNEYGNVDWKGPKTDITKDPQQRFRKVLTWKGPPSRYWPVGTFDQIDGVTVVDHMVEGVMQDTWYMTPFTGNVYEHGRVVARMPNLYWPLGNNSIYAAQVFGAAYREVDGKLVAVVKTCYNAYPRYKEPQEMVSTWQVRYQYPDKPWYLYQDWLEDRSKANEQTAELNAVELARYDADPSYVMLKYEVFEVPDPGRGYWFEVLLREASDDLAGWHRLLRVSTSSSYANTNWFFSEDGTKACSVLFGKLHRVVLEQDEAGVTTASYILESLGGFKNTINTDNSQTRIDNIGVQDPSIPENDFAFKFRVGLEVGDWLEKTDTYKTYTSVKSGTVTLAADYKGNKLVKMQATLSGSEVYDYHRTFGFKWGLTALPASTQVDDFNRVPAFGDISNPFPSSGGSSGVYCIGAMHVCKPVYQSSFGTQDPDNPACFRYDPCLTNSMRSLTITAKITDEAGGRYIDLQETFPVGPHQLHGAWKTDYQSPCGSAIYAGYYFEGGWKRVWYGPSSIPRAITIIAPSDLHVSHTDVDDCGVTRTWVDVVAGLAGVAYMLHPSGNLCRIASAGTGWVSTQNQSDHGWYDSWGGYTLEVGGPSWQSYAPGCILRPGWYHWAYTQYALSSGVCLCNSYGSDSYLTGLVDSEMNPITVPTNDTYYWKVFKVESLC